VAKDHAHPDAIGVVDESAVAKSGDDTVGAARQWDGNRGRPHTREFILFPRGTESNPNTPGCERVVYLPMR
jgi:hypothetical protein